MQPQKIRWSKVYESSEEELTKFLAARGIEAVRHDIAEFEAFEQPNTPVVTLWCAEGSMNVSVNQARALSLQPGDALRIPAGTDYQAKAGISGCVYYLS